VVLRCLIVDDNPGFLHAARTILEQEGLQVVGVASTGTEAVERAADLRPDLILIDIDLGAENGFELAQRLADDPHLDPGRLILISAGGEDEFAEMIEGSPAIGFLGKPALSAQAIETLVRAAGGGQDEPDETVGP
jgi:DNA-binding NarL/FixJ family response regulator